MAIVEDIEESEQPTSSGPPITKVWHQLEHYLDRLKLPAELLRVDKEHPKPQNRLDEYKYVCLGALRDVCSILEAQRASGQSLGDEDAVKVCYTLVCLAGTDDWCSASSRKAIGECLAALQPPRSAPHLILLNHIKPLFASKSHPDIHPETARKLSRPAGGEQARTDMFEGQHWKLIDGAGSWNALRWSVDKLDADDLAQDIGLILPPLLIMLDDYEPVYRLRGMDVLEVILRKLRPETMKRMGIDSLFVKSIQSSIALHPSYPHPVILSRSFQLLVLILRTIQGTPPASAERAKEIAEAVEKGIINGWQYAPSGFEGVRTLQGIANTVEMLCDEIGVEVVRWLKSFIPSLIACLFLPPSASSMPLQIANLSALRAVLDAIESTGRAARWRGQILNAVARAYLGCCERIEIGTDEEKDAADLRRIQVLCVDVVRRLVKVAPAMAQDELPSMVNLNPHVFEPLRQAATAG